MVMKLITRSHEPALAVIGIVFVFIALVVGYHSAAREKVSSDGQEFESDLKKVSETHTSLRCEISSQERESDVEGTVIIASGQFKGDIRAVLRSREGGRIVRHHILYDTRNFYAWSDDLDPGRGIKMSPEEFLARSRKNDQLHGDIITADRRFHFSCAPWTLKRGTFAPPQGVTFQPRYERSNGFEGSFVPLDTKLNEDTARVLST